MLPFGIRGLVKKSYLFPCNFLGVTGSVLKISMDIHWTFTYTQEKLCIDTLTRFVCVTSEGFGTAEMVKICTIIEVDQNELPFNEPCDHTSDSYSKMQ